MINPLVQMNQHKMISVERCIDRIPLGVSFCNTYCIASKFPYRRLDLDRVLGSHS